MKDIPDRARVGFMDDNYEVFICTDDPGNQPHVHICNTKKKSSGSTPYFETCVRLDCNAYFIHELHTDVFDEKERKMFAEFMKSKPLKNKHYLTHYEFAIDLWNENNYNTQIQPRYKMLEGKECVIIPDYENMDVKK